MGGVYRGDGCVTRQSSLIQTRRRYWGKCAPGSYSPSNARGELQASASLLVILVLEGVGPLAVGPRLISRVHDCSVGSQLTRVVLLQLRDLLC